MARVGVRPEDYPPVVIELWPDNAQIHDVFRAMQTQWHTGPMGHATGLDYNALPFVMRRNGVRRRDLDDVFDGIQVMELAALTEMSKG